MRWSFVRFVRCSLVLRVVAVLAALASFGYGPRTGRSASSAEMCSPSSRQVRAARLDETSITFARLGARRMRLDLAVPATPGPHPLVLLVHGGAWRRGHRSYMNGTMRAFAARGYAAATVDYRLAAAPRNVFPGPVSDLRCAVRTLRRRAPELGLDPARFAAAGFSAGGHLVSLLATAADVDALDDGSCPVTPDVSPAVQAALSFYGPHDLRAPLRVGPGADGAIRNLLGVSRQADPARAELASPVAHVDPRDPPMFLVHGLRDRIVEVDQSRRMRDALRAAGVRVTSLELPRSSHGFGLFPRRRTDDPAVACSALSFLTETLPPRPRPGATRWAQR